MNSIIFTSKTPQILIIHSIQFITKFTKFLVKKKQITSYEI